MENFKEITEFVKLFINILKEIAWPLAVIIIFFSLKKPLTRLIERIKKAGIKEFGVEFAPDTQNTKSSKNPLNAIKVYGSDNDIKNKLKVYNEKSIQVVEKIMQSEISINDIAEPNEKVELLTDYSKLLLFILNYNRIYNVIYGSQLEILYSLDIIKTQKKMDLRRYYDKAVEIYPDFYKNYNYNQYINFLEDSELISSTEDGNASLTEFGKDFLKYINVNGLITKKIL